VRLPGTSGLARTCAQQIDRISGDGRRRGRHPVDRGRHIARDVDRVLQDLAVSARLLLEDLPEVVGPGRGLAWVEFERALHGSVRSATISTVMVQPGMPSGSKLTSAICSSSHAMTA